MWGLLSHCKPSFGQEDYERIGRPDLRRLVFRDGQGTIDHSFSFGLSQSDSGDRRSSS